MHGCIGHKQTKGFLLHGNRKNIVSINCAQGNQGGGLHCHEVWEARLPKAISVRSRCSTRGLPLARWADRWLQSIR